MARINRSPLSTSLSIAGVPAFSLSLSDCHHERCDSSARTVLVYESSLVTYILKSTHDVTAVANAVTTATHSAFSKKESAALVTVDCKMATWRPTLWDDADRHCHRRQPSACGQHASNVQPTHKRRAALGRAQLDKDQACSGKPKDKAVCWSRPMNATCATSAGARVQQRIRRNKICFMYAYFGIFFLQRLISGSIRSLTASEERLNEVRGWV